MIRIVHKNNIRIHAIKFANFLTCHTMLSEAKIKSIFCIVDDMLKASGHKDDIASGLVTR